MLSRVVMYNMSLLSSGVVYYKYGLVFSVVDCIVLVDWNVSVLHVE